MKKLGLLILVLTMVVSLCACGKAGDYEAAIALMEAGNYTEAVAAFAELGDYEDSVQKLEECENILSYAEAVALFEEEQYEDALAIFTALGNYQDSVEKKLECEKALAYQNALDLIATGDYENAYTTLMSLEEYKDVPELLTHFKEVEITPENWREYFVVVEEPEYTKNDFNENTNVNFAYCLLLNEEIEKCIYNPAESKVIFEFEYLTVLKDVPVSKTADEYEIIQVPGNWGTSTTWDGTLVWEMEQSENEPIYHTAYAAPPAFGPGQEAPQNGKMMVEEMDAVRAQGSIYIYE